MMCLYYYAILFYVSSLGAQIFYKVNTIHTYFSSHVKKVTLTCFIAMKQHIEILKMGHCHLWDFLIILRIYRKD